MSALLDAFEIAKKILTVSADLDRLSQDARALAHTVTDHEIRLVRIETTLEIARRPSPLTLPGN